VNNFDEAIFVREGRNTGLEAVKARGHEVLLAQSTTSPVTSAAS
jgi:hypothetical protein